VHGTWCTCRDHVITRTVMVRARVPVQRRQSEDNGRLTPTSGRAIPFITAILIGALSFGASTVRCTSARSILSLPRCTGSTAPTSACKFRVGINGWKREGMGWRGERGRFEHGAIPRAASRKLTRYTARDTVASASLHLICPAYRPPLG